MTPKYMKVTRTAVYALSIVALTAAFAHAGEGGEETATMKDWMWRVLDFGIIAGVLAYFVAKPLKGFLRKRSEDIEAALAEARAAREEALRRLSDVQARLKDKDAEVASLVRLAEENGKKEKELLVKESDKMASDILSSAKENIGAELFKAREALRREAALLAIELAEKLVKENIKKEDQARILEDYIAKVGGR